MILIQPDFRGPPQSGHIYTHICIDRHIHIHYLYMTRTPHKVLCWDRRGLKSVGAPALDKAAASGWRIQLP